MTTYHTRIESSTVLHAVNYITEQSDQYIELQTTDQSISIKYNKSYETFPISYYVPVYHFVLLHHPPTYSMHCLRRARLHRIRDFIELDTEARNGSIPGLLGTFFRLEL
jgi:hypothetical protein